MKTPMPIRLLLLVLLAAPSLALAQAESDKESPEERAARLARRGAGLRVGIWSVRSLRDAPGGTDSETPAIEGWHQRGIDKHVSLENSLAFWSRKETVTQSGGPFGGTTTQTVTTYILPMLTSVQFHPFTGPEQRVEPMIRAGGGVALGFESRQGSSGGLFGGSEGTAAVLGFVLDGSTGATVRLSRAFGLTASVGYRWTHFQETLAGLREYKGYHGEAGLFYRFQYR